MGKLREAAVVVAVLGGVSMLGAGVASADGWEFPGLPNVPCTHCADTTGNGQTSGPATGGDAAIAIN